MGKTYSEKLKSPKWQKRRLEIMERDGFQCQMCFNRDETLTVHHKEYISGKEPWEYEDDLLVTLCEKCHKKVHHNIELEKNGILFENILFECNITDWTILIHRIWRIYKIEGKQSIKTIIQLLTSYTINIDEI